MQRFTIFEYGKIPRDAIDARTLYRLQRFDDQYSRHQGDSIFDWSRLREIVAKSYVGVIQIPGLSVEILPKVDAEGQIAEGRVQDNLLYMLQLSRHLPLRTRGLAEQQLKRRPLLEALIQAFANSLLTELRRGVQHAYVTREANLNVLRGRLVTHEHIRQNRTRQDRLYVRYDEFIADTLLNRILKRACQRLLSICNSNRTSQLISEALLELADVGDQQIRLHHFDSLILDRSSERYRPLIEFSRIVLADATVSPAAGATNAFSLLFPMEQVFEEFIGQFVRRYAGNLGISRQAIHIQAASRGKWLLRTAGGAGKFRLRRHRYGPDSAHPRFVVDTKWKRLKSDAVDATNGVGQGDLYQLYAYAHRYDSPLNVLLYPHVSGVTNKTYQLADDPQKRLLHIALVDLSQNLLLTHQALIDDLRQALAVQLQSSDLFVLT